MTKTPPANKTTDVRVSVHRIQGGDVPAGEMTITLEDVSSGVRVAEITIGAVDFANCLTGLPGHASCAWRGLGVIGKKWETKTVTIDPPKTSKWKNRHSAICEINNAVKDDLVDGWFVFSDGLSSQQPTGKHVVVLGRYV